MRAIAMITLKMDQIAIVAASVSRLSFRAANFSDRKYLISSEFRYSDSRCASVRCIKSIRHDGFHWPVFGRALRSQLFRPIDSSVGRCGTNKDKLLVFVCARLVTSLLGTSSITLLQRQIRSSNCPEFCSLIIETRSPLDSGHAWRASAAAAKLLDAGPHIIELHWCSICLSLFERFFPSAWNLDQPLYESHGRIAFSSKAHCSVGQNFDLDMSDFLIYLC